VVWATRDPSAPWAPESLAFEGFVHCTDGDDEIAAVANRYYRDDPQRYVVVTLDLDRAGSPWRIDDPGTPYPHVYGPVAPEAILGVRDMPRDADGRFMPPAGRAEEGADQAAPRTG
jgi:uncharacterized protein (DUF952 family)